MKFCTFVSFRKHVVGTLGAGALVMAAIAQNQIPIDAECDCDALAQSAECVDVVRCGFFGPHSAPCTGVCGQVIGGVDCLRAGRTYRSVTWGTVNASVFVGTSQPLNDGTCGCLSNEATPTVMAVPTVTGGLPCFSMAWTECRDECI